MDPENEDGPVETQSQKKQVGLPRVKIKNTNNIYNNKLIIHSIAATACVMMTLCDWSLTMVYLRTGTRMTPLRCLLPVRVIWV